MSKSKKRDLEKQAIAVLRRHKTTEGRHALKLRLGIKGSASTGKIHAQSTFNKYTSALKMAGKWCNERYGVTWLNNITNEMAQKYLEYRAGQSVVNDTTLSTPMAGVCQEQLNADFTALSFLKGLTDLKRIKIDRLKEQVNRVYTLNQIELLKSKMRWINQFRTDLVLATGCRAKELITLHPLDSGVAAKHRQWLEDRFDGLEGIRYLVTGKGNLTREIMIPSHLAEILETLRLPQEVTIVDRGIIYNVAYDLGGGNAWSTSFTRASNKTFDWSLGGHALRFMYARRRMASLSYKYPYLEALEIVSQEMGHFDRNKTKVYL